MFSKYLQEVYPEESNNSYPDKLCNYLVENYLKGSKENNVKFLDVGCGKGTHLKSFMKILEGDFYGVDVNESKIEGVKINACNLEKQRLPFPENYFDIVFSKSVLEHVSNTDNFISEIYRVLKPGGRLIILVPDWQSQMKNFYDDYTHIKPFTIKSINSALKINGFKNVSVSYFIQLPLIWKFSFLVLFCKIISIIFPESFKWKSIEGRNTKDRKWIRFSKEKMLLGVCVK